MQKVINVSDLNEIVLTNDGVVVGHIKLSRLNSNIEFVGQAVNYRTRISMTKPNYDPSSNTNNSFACGFSIDKADADEIKLINYLQTAEAN